jgi:hypothetical protein
MTTSLRNQLARFIKNEQVDGNMRIREVSTLAEADGILFQCPLCCLSTCNVVVRKSEHVITGTTIDDISVEDPVMVTSRNHAHYFLAVESGTIDTSC